MNLMGIDAGTTGLKAMLFDSADGKELGSGYVEYAFATPGPDRAEIDPEIYREELIKVLKSKKINETDPYKRKAKLAQYAMQKGYEPSVVWDVVRHFE